MFDTIDAKLVIKERIDHAEETRRVAACRRARRSRHGITEQLHRFADRLDS